MAQDLVDKFIFELNGDNCIRQAGIMSFLTAEYFVDGWFSDKCRRLYKARLGPAIVVSNGVDFSVFFAQTPWVGMTLDNLDHFFKKKQESNLTEAKEFYKIKKACALFYKKVNNALVLKNSSKIKLILIIKSAVKFSQDALSASAFAEALDDELLLKIFKENNVSELKAIELIELVKKPSFESISLTTDKGLLYSKKLNEIQWLFTSYYSTPLLSELDKKVSFGIKEKGGKNKLESEVKRISKDVEKNKKELLSVRKTLDKKERIIVDFALFNMRMRDERIEPIKKAMTVVHNATLEYSKRIGFDEKLIPFLFVNELIDKKKSIEELTKIALSRKNGLIIFISQKEKLFSKLDYVSSIKKMDEFMHKGIDGSELKGSVANKGFVKGIVKLILNEKDFSKFNEGDVLVASMTRIEYVPLMKKAGAIITDEGGITCHAAIVSRELNKPCIIGTKIATKVLHDGDLVEVNANTGLVRIISSLKV